MKRITTITATTVGGRDGHGTTTDGNADIKFALPKELGGAGKKGATPEHLFGLGYAACFGTNLQLHAGKKNIKLDPNFRSRRRSSRMSWLVATPPRVEWRWASSLAPLMATPPFRSAGLRDFLPGHGWRAF